MNPEVQPRTLAIASGKGGVGKSFLALNLAWCLGELGQRVLLIELDADAGALSVAAGLGEPRALPAAADASTMARRAVSLPGNARVSLLRASDIAPQSARSPAALEPLLTQLPAAWRIVDLAPGIGAQNVAWLRRATASLLIGTPELVSVQAMLRLHLQLQRQHSYEWLCVREPRLRGGPPSLTVAKQRLAELCGVESAKRLCHEALQAFVPAHWTFNRVLSDDALQLGRIANYLRAQAGPDAAAPWIIPEDPAQARCARYGRVLSASDAQGEAALAVRRIGDELLARYTVCRTSDWQPQARRA